MKICIDLNKKERKMLMCALESFRYDSTVDLRDQYFIDDLHDKMVLAFKSTCALNDDDLNDDD